MNNQPEKSCTYCGKRPALYEVRSWNKDNEVRYYCQEHYQEAQQRENDECKRFIEYYSSPSTQKWLSEKSLNLWKKLSKKGES